MPLPAWLGAEPSPKPATDVSAARQHRRTQSRRRGKARVGVQKGRIGRDQFYSNLHSQIQEKERIKAQQKDEDRRKWRARVAEEAKKQQVEKQTELEKQVHGVCDENRNRSWLIHELHVHRSLSAGCFAHAWRGSWRNARGRNSWRSRSLRNSWPHRPTLFLSGSVSWKKRR